MGIVHARLVYLQFDFEGVFDESSYKSELEVLVYSSVKLQLKSELEGGHAKLIMFISELQMNF